MSRHAFGHVRVPVSIGAYAAHACAMALWHGVHPIIGQWWQIGALSGAYAGHHHTESYDAPN